MTERMFPEPVKFVKVDKFVIKDSKGFYDRYWNKDLNKWTGLIQATHFTKEEVEEKESIFINEEMIQSKIYCVRGQKVMLDYELAEIYGYETKNFNRQVKNNKAKFEGDDFMFQLTKDEWENLRCKIRWNCVLILMK